MILFICTFSETQCLFLAFDFVTKSQHWFNFLISGFLSVVGGFTVTGNTIFGAEIGITQYIQTKGIFIYILSNRFYAFHYLKLYDHLEGHQQLYL